MAFDPGYVILKWWRKYIKPLRPGTKKLKIHDDLLEFHKTAAHVLTGAFVGTGTGLLVKIFNPWWFLVAGIYACVIIYEELIVDKGLKQWKRDNTVDTFEKLTGVVLCIGGIITWPSGWLGTQMWIDSFRWLQGQF